MVKNRKLSRAISQQGWGEFRTLCEAKSEKFGREFIVVGKWELTSQVCSNCGFKWGKLDLKTRSIQCLDCQTIHDRDENAAKNINKVGMGYRHDSKWAQRQGKTTSVAPVDEASRITAHERTVSISNNCLIFKAADALVKSVVAIAQKRAFLSYHLSPRSPLFAP